MALDTPLRRSTRGQPLPSQAPLQLSDVVYIPSGEPTYERDTVPSDVFDDEKDSSDFDISLWKTRYFSTFTRKNTMLVRRAPKVYGRTSKGKGKERVLGDDTSETFKVGDTVLMKTIAKKASVAVIVAVMTVAEEGGTDRRGCRVMVHWFNRPFELPSIRARRDYEENEIYYSLSSTATVPPYNIISACTVSSSRAEPSVPKRKPSYSYQNETPGSSAFYCVSAIDPRRGLFYALDWDDFRKDALSKDGLRNGSMDAWTVVPHEGKDEEEEDEDERRSLRKTTRDRSSRRRIRGNKGTEEDRTDDEAANRRMAKRSRKTRAAAEESSGGEEEGSFFEVPLNDLDASEEEIAPDEDEDEPVPTTPRKRKRGASTPHTPRTPCTPRTPRKARTSKEILAQPTPHSKAALRKRKRTALAVRPPPQTDTGISLQLDGVLGPTAGKNPWLRAMHVLHVAARPEALPCREEEYGRILRSVEELLEEGSGGCIYISGVPGTGKTATVHAVVRELKRMAEHNEANPFTYVEINGLRIPEPAAAYGLLWEAVCGHDVSREGHMKIGSREALKSLQKHFSAGERAGPGGHACVVLMDELDQLMTTKQDVVYNFFNWPTLVGSKLVVLAVANTMDLPERVMTGRVRSRLGMTRINFQPYTTPQLEQIVRARLQSAKEGLPADTLDVIAADGVKFAAMKVSSISGDARRVLDICRRAVELVQPRSKTARTDDVKEVIKSMQNSPTAAYLRELSFHERLMLAALLRCIKREGVEEIKWGDLQHQHCVYIGLLASEDDPVRRPAPGELRVVLDSLTASHALLCEEGAAVTRRPEDDRRIALTLEHTEVERVLGEVGGAQWKNTLSV